jgi:hypothetical protein
VHVGGGDRGDASKLVHDLEELLRAIGPPDLAQGVADLADGGQLA